MADTQLHIECACGFQGAIRLVSGYGRCFGCDSIYNESGEKLNGPPSFASMKELMEWSANINQGRLIQEKEEKKPTKEDFANKDKMVYSATHFYLRPGASWKDVLKDAQSERQVRNSNVVVMAHKHPYDYNCPGKSCKTL